MTLKLGDVFPDFTANTTIGNISFYEYMGQGNYCILFSHPRDFTPVCTTELAALGLLKPEFDKRQTKLIALSCDTVADHMAWLADIQSHAKSDSEYPIPIIADPQRELATKFGMLDAEEKDAGGMPFTCRSVFIVGPDKRLKLSILYPATTGRNIPEILRVVDSLQLTAVKKVATPADWKNGDKCMVVPSLSTADARSLFPGGVEIETMPSGKEYMRYTPHPK